MEKEDIQQLIASYHRKLAKTDLTFKRYLYPKINWDARLIGIKGARGVGKTTLLLQRIKETFDHPDEAFYVSLDNYWFQTHTLPDLVDYLYTHGVTHLFFDEIHKYKDWLQLLKNFYDNYPDLYIVYTGSSMLEIDYSKTDLSRRQSLYTLEGLSFREYLEYEGTLRTEPLKMEDLLKKHVPYALEICSSIKILKHFDTYLQNGYYPFYKEAEQDYAARLQDVVNLVIESDLPSVEEITYQTVEKTKKLLMVIAGKVPFVPNVNQLGGILGATRDSCLKMLYSLDKAGILCLLTDHLKNYRKIASPEKIYLNNTNLIYALNAKADEGNKRETFFANQAGAVYPLQIPKAGDFLADEKYLFEVGGRNKTFEQIADLPDSYLAIDGIETGNGNRIPLWMFGLLY